MSDFDIVDVPSQPCLLLRRTCRHEQLGEFFMEALPKIFGVAMAQGAVAGPPSARYPDWRETDCDVEAMVPTAGELGGEGEITAGSLGGFRAVHTTHRGPYDQLSETHGKLHAHVMEQGYEMAGAPMEVYIDDPTTLPPEQVRTEIYWPIQ